MDHFTRDRLPLSRLGRWRSGSARGRFAARLPAAAVDVKQVAELLQERCLRTLVPAQRGYVATARPRGRRSYRATETVGDVLALIDQASLSRVDVVGHDWGGARAWALSAGSPAGSRR